MSTMTLEQVRMQIAALGYNETRARWLETIDAHLTQPAQAVDVKKVRKVIAELRAVNSPLITTVDERHRFAALLTAALPKDSNGAEGVGS